jgi:hypothetical protein
MICHRGHDPVWTLALCAQRRLWRASWKMERSAFVGETGRRYVIGGLTVDPSDCVFE